MNEAERGFWRLETREEFDLIQRVLERRFGPLLRELSAALDEADPLEIVYPGNSGEYDDVVREFVVLMQGRDIRSLGDVQQALARSFAVRFDEPIEAAALAVISERLAEHGLGALRDG